MQITNYLPTGDKFGVEVNFTHIFKNRNSIQPAALLFTKSHSYIL